MAVVDHGAVPDGSLDIDDDETETQHFLGLADDSQRKWPPNSLPKLQLAIVLLLRVCEPITSQSIIPYINQARLLRRSRENSSHHFQQLITELDITGGDDRKVGYYAGLIVECKLVLVELCGH
jgi:hypothetical protein